MNNLLALVVINLDIFGLNLDSLLLSASDARCGLLFPPLVEVDALLVLTLDDAVGFELVAPFEEPLVLAEDEVLEDDEVVDEDEDEVDAESLLTLAVLRLPLMFAVTLAKLT